MLIKPRTLVGFSLCLLVVACGPGTDTTGETDGGTSDSGETSDGEGGSSGASQEQLCAEAPDPDGPDPFPGEQSCADFNRPVNGSGALPVTVVIRNASDEALLVYDRVFGCQHEARYFDLSGSASGRSLYLPSTNCALDWPSCGSLLEEDSCLLCQTLNPPIYLAPGGYVEREWDRSLLAELEMPGECLPDGGDAMTCSRYTPAGAGSYTATADAARMSDCSEAEMTCVDESDCQGGALDANGACLLEPQESWDLPIAVTAEASWNGLCDQLELVLGG